MVVQHNLSAFNASRMYSLTSGAQVKSTEKLSSGYKINRAADGAAQLAISEKMRRQIRGLTRATENIQEGVGYVQTADGALNEAQALLQRMNELAVAASKDTLSPSDRQALDSEVQQLKGEMDRIFSTTSFNERLIWNPNTEEKVQIDTIYPRTTNDVGGGASFDITNANAGIVPAAPTGSYTYIKILADETKGIAATWTGYDGKTYTTDYKSVNWKALPGTTYNFNLSELYPPYDKDNAAAEGNKFYDSTGKPLMDAPFGFSSIAEAKPEDIISSINNSSIKAYSGVYATPSTNISGSMSMSATLEYSAAYKSYMAKVANGFDFNQDIADMITPKKTGITNVTHPDYSIKPEGNNGTWTISFNMAGIGDVVAKLTSIQTESSDRSDSAKGQWWSWDTYGNGIKYKRSTTYTYPGAMTMAGVVDALTGSFSSTTPGVLSSANKGAVAADATGSIKLNFTISDTSGNKVGSLSFSNGVGPTTTVDDIVDNLKKTFSDSTVIDINPSLNESMHRMASFGSLETRGVSSEVPVYKAVNSLQIQAGSEAGQYISISYDSLSTYVLGINGTNVDPFEEAQKAIASIKKAMEIVNAQRSDFGAYQNRLEHAYYNLENVVENTTEAESQIRDTDMSQEIMNYSNNNILMQAGQSMVASANQSMDAVLSLLQ